MSKLEKLQKRKAEGRSALWKLVDVVEHDGAAMLLCKSCKCRLSAVNPSQAFKQHFHDEKCCQSNKRKSSEVVRDMHSFIANKEQVKHAVRHLSRFIFKNNIAFRLIEDEELRKALAIFGVNLPDRKALRTQYLPREYDAARARVNTCLQNAECFGICSDGWRSKFCGEGQPLTNYCALMPDGGSMFVKVTWGAEHN